MALAPTSSRPSDGGTQPVEVLSVPLAFNTPGLVLTGINLGYTTAIGDVFVGVAVEIDTAWNGTFPTLYVYLNGAAPFTTGDQIFTGPLTAADATVGIFGVLQPQIAHPVDLCNWRASIAAPLKAVVDNNSGGNPVSSQGAGRLVFVIAKA